MCIQIQGVGTINQSTTIINNGVYDGVGLGSNEECFLYSVPGSCVGDREAECIEAEDCAYALKLQR